MQPLSVALVIANREIVSEVLACIRDLPVRILLEQPEIADWAGMLDKLGRLQPDVVLLELNTLREPLAEVIRRIRAAPGSPVVFAVHDAKEPEVILQAIRAGAAEYLYRPLNPSLAAALERISSERAAHATRAQPRGKTVGFLSAKGGCGATTIACHAAVEVQRQTGQETLLADFDVDSGLVGFLMKTKSPYSLADALHNIQRLDLSYWKALVSNGVPGLEVIAAPACMSSRQAPDRDRLRHVLRFVRSHYDWVVVDLGRSLGPGILNTLEEVDTTFLITTADVPALYYAKHILQVLSDSGYARDHMRLVVNRASRRADLTRDELERIVGVPPSAVLPDEYAALCDAYAGGNLLPPNSSFGRHMAALVRHIAGSPQEKGKKLFSLFN